MLSTNSLFLQAFEVVLVGKSHGFIYSYYQEVKVLRTLAVMVLAVVTLAGCQDRVIWNDNGKLESSTEEREIWDSNGQMDSGDRKIWVNKDGKEIIK